MSEEQLKAFLEKVQSDTSLQDKLKEAKCEGCVVSIAEEAGFSISADDLKNAQSDASDEELESAAGGFMVSPRFIESMPMKNCPPDVPIPSPHKPPH